MGIFHPVAALIFVHKQFFGGEALSCVPKAMGFFIR